MVWYVVKLVVLLPLIGLAIWGSLKLAQKLQARLGVAPASARAVLASKRISGAIGRCLIPRREAGYNHVLAHESGELYSV